MNTITECRQPSAGFWHVGFGRERSRALHGFSLVEVVLALGVVSIAIVSLLGLLSISTGSSRLSDEDTVIAAIARQVDTELRNSPASPFSPSSGFKSGDIWYFDNEGHRLTTDVVKAIYQCQINLTADPGYDSTDSSGNKTTNLYHVELVFSRASASKAPILQSITTALYRND
jgi:uncharacterized protein (TIGR02598 family)